MKREDPTDPTVTPGEKAALTAGKMLIGGGLTALVGFGVVQVYPKVVAYASAAFVGGIVLLYLADPSTDRLMATELTSVRVFSRPGLAVMTTMTAAILGNYIHSVGAFWSFVGVMFIIACGVVNVALARQPEDQ